MPEAVYITCLLTSLLCALLLFRSYRAQRGRLLFWSMLCFFGLAVDNALLVLDLVILPDVDLAILRASVYCGSGLALLGGLVWELR